MLAPSNLKWQWLRRLKRSGDHRSERLRVDLGPPKEIEVEVARRFIQMRIDQRPNGLVLLEVIRAMEIEHATERRAQRRYRVQSAQRSNRLTRRTLERRSYRCESGE